MDIAIAFTIVVFGLFYSHTYAIVAASRIVLMVLGREVKPGFAIYAHLALGCLATAIGIWWLAVAA